MASSRISFAALSVIAALGLNLPGATLAAVSVDANGASIEGPEAPEPSPERAASIARKDAPARVVVTARGETNLRRTPTFIAVLGARAAR